MYNYKYIDEHYEEMRALLVTAKEKTSDDGQRSRLETMLVCFDFLGLTCVHHRYYKNTDNEELRQLYRERYDHMYEYIRDNNMVIFSNDTYTLPTLNGEDRYSEDPMYQFYKDERKDGRYDGTN